MKRKRFLLLALAAFLLMAAPAAPVIAAEDANYCIEYEMNGLQSTTASTLADAHAALERHYGQTTPKGFRYTVRLLQDVTDTSILQPHNGSTVTLDLNGHTLTVTGISADQGLIYNNALSTRCDYTITSSRGRGTLILDGALGYFNPKSYGVSLTVSNLDVTVTDGDRAFYIAAASSSNYQEGAIRLENVTLSAANVENLVWLRYTGTSGPMDRFQLGVSGSSLQIGSALVINESTGGYEEGSYVQLDLDSKIRNNAGTLPASVLPIQCSDDSQASLNGWSDGWYSFGEEPQAHVHAYGEPTWNWAEDRSSAEAVFLCACEDAVTREAAVVCDTTPATYDAPGKQVYTAAVTFEGSTYTDEVTKILPQLERPAVTVPQIGADTDGELVDFRQTVAGDGTVTTAFKPGADANAPEITVTSNWTEPGETGYAFTVSSTGDVACAVLVQQAGGGFRRLEADASGIAPVSGEAVHCFITGTGFDPAKDSVLVAVLGDLNGDGLVNGRDAAQMQRVAVQSREATEAETLVCDINRDGAVNGRDAAQVQRAAVGSRRLEW